MIFSNIFKRQHPRYSADNIIDLEFALSHEFIDVCGRTLHQSISFTSSGDILSDLLLGRYKEPLMVYAIPIASVQYIINTINNFLLNQAGVKKMHSVDFITLYNKHCENAFDGSAVMNIPKLYQRDFTDDSHSCDCQLNALCDNLGTNGILYVFSNSAKPDNIFDIIHANDQYDSGNRLLNLTHGCFNDALIALGRNRSFTQYILNRLMGLITTSIMFMMYGDKSFLERYMMRENLLWGFVQRLYEGD